MRMSGDRRSEDAIAVVRNEARCLNCGDHLRSDSAYSGVQWCSCGSVAVYGGTEHIMRAGNPSCLEELAEELLADGTVRRLADRRFCDGPGGEPGARSEDAELSRFCDGAGGEEWRALDEVKLKQFRKRRSWEQYPAIVEFVVQYPAVDEMGEYDPRNGAGIADAERCFADLSDAVRFARRMYRRIALMPLNRDNKLTEQVALYRREVEYLPFMGREFLPDDLEMVTCPQCGEEVERYRYDDELEMCNTCISLMTRGVLSVTGGYSKHVSGKKGLRHSSDVVRELAGSGFRDPGPRGPEDPGGS